MDRPARPLWVRKRDRRCEPFDATKLAAAMMRGFVRGPEARRQAVELARAVEVFLRRQRKRVVSSSALFEMALKALRRVHQGAAAEVLELYRSLRASRRRLLRVRHDDGRVTHWDKSWLVKQAESIWGISTSAARIIAGTVEMDLLPQEPAVVARGTALEALNEQVVAFGLADAVPVR